jgi:hypothetical protein
MKVSELLPAAEAELQKRIEAIAVNALVQKLWDSKVAEINAEERDKDRKEYLNKDIMEVVIDHVNCSGKLIGGRSL